MWELIGCLQLHYMCDGGINYRYAISEENNTLKVCYFSLDHNKVAVDAIFHFREFQHNE